MLTVFVVCTGNSCRSVMAEALFTHLGKGQIQVYSAGSHPLRRLNQNALATLKRHGLSSTGYQSQSWDEFNSISMDIVITVCDQAAREDCPAYLNQAVRVHWGVTDPSYVDGTETDIHTAFDEVFFSLKIRIEKMLALPLETLNPDELSCKLNALGP